MKYISVSEFAQRHGVSERTARNYCNLGKIEGAYLMGKTWNIPEDAELPSKKSRAKKVSQLLQALREQKQMKIKGFQDGNGRVGRLIMFKECLAAQDNYKAMLDYFKIKY